MKDEYFATKMIAMENEIKLNQACSFLKMDMPKFLYNTIEERIKELCIIKICNVLGIRCSFNYKNGFLDFFSSVMGEALSEKLNLNLSIASPNLRLVKYNHFNLVSEVKEMLDNPNLHDAFINAFNFLEDFKYLLQEKYLA